MWLELTHVNKYPILVNMSTVQSVVRTSADGNTVLYYANTHEDYVTDEVVETVEFIREKLLWK